MEVKYPDIKIEMLMPQRRVAVAKVLTRAAELMAEKPLSITHALELIKPFNQDWAWARKFIHECLEGKPFPLWLDPKANLTLADCWAHERKWLTMILDRLSGQQPVSVSFDRLSSQPPVKVSFEDPQYDDYNGRRNIRIRIVKVVWCNGAKVGVVYTDSSSLRYHVSIDLVRRARPNPELACNFSRATLQGAYNTATKVIHSQVEAVSALFTKKCLTEHS